MNDLIESFITEHFFNLACMQSFDLIQLLSAVVDESAGKLLAPKIKTENALPDPQRSAHIL